MLWREKRTLALGMRSYSCNMITRGHADGAIDRVNDVITRFGRELGPAIEVEHPELPVDGLRRSQVEQGKRPPHNWLRGWLEAPVEHQDRRVDHAPSVLALRHLTMGTLRGFASPFGPTRPRPPPSLPLRGLRDRTFPTTPARYARALALGLRQTSPMVRGERSSPAPHANTRQESAIRSLCAALAASVDGGLDRRSRPRIAGRAHERVMLTDRGRDGKGCKMPRS